MYTKRSIPAPFCQMQQSTCQKQNLPEITDSIQPLPCTNDTSDHTEQKEVHACNKTAPTPQTHCSYGSLIALLLLLCQQNE